MRVKPYKQDVLVNVARNNKKQSNIERIPIYDYSVKNAYFNPHNRLGPDPGEEFVARNNLVREVDKNEPLEISEAELKRILREDDEPQDGDKSNIGYRDEPDEISEAEMKRILREDELPSADELQALMEQSGATKDEIIEALKQDSKSKDVLRDNKFNSFVFPPHEKSRPLAIIPSDIQQILDDTGGNSYTNINPALRDNLSEKHIYSKPHKLNVDLQKLLQDDATRFKHVIMSRDEEDFVDNSEEKSGNVRKSFDANWRFHPQKIVLDLQKYETDSKLLNVLKVRSNDRDFGVFGIPEQKIGSDIQRKSSRKKPNYLFRSVLPGQSAIFQVVQKAPIKKVSSDYFDFDYYFGRRERTLSDFKKIPNIYNDKAVRSRQSKFYFVIFCFVSYS